MLIVREEMLYEIYDMPHIVCLIYVIILTFSWVYPKCIVMYFGYAEYAFLSLLLCFNHRNYDVVSEQRFEYRLGRRDCGLRASRPPPAQAYINLL